MSPPVKLVGGTVLAGLMIAIALITLRSETAPKMPPPQLELSDNKDPLSPELTRCAVVTTPDAACEIVWAAHRRRFFGEADALADDASIPNVVPGNAVTADEPLP